MSFPYNVYVLSFLAAFCVALFALPLWRKWCLRIGLVDDPGHRKIHGTPIPLAGGLAVLTGVLVPLALGAVALRFRIVELERAYLLETYVIEWFRYGFSQRGGQLLAVFIGAVGMVALGWLDDRHELRPAIKFVGQAVIAALVVMAGIRITLFVGNPLFSYVVTVLWILTVTNACNFMDNMNGLCTGLGFIAAWCFAWSAAINGQLLVTSIALLTCGALLGFLPFNFPKATAFLGDTGSHLVGYLLAVLAILPDFYSRRNPDTLAVFKPVLILLVLLGDLVWVVILRLRNGQPFYVGDTNHLSHRLVRRGLSNTHAVLLIWFMAALAGWLSFL